MRPTTYIKTLLLLSLLSYSAAHAEDDPYAGFTRPKLWDAAMKYCQANAAKNNNQPLPYRVVKIEIGNRKVQRVFVPVLDNETALSFGEHFQANTGAYIYRKGRDETHVSIYRSPKEVMKYTNVPQQAAHYYDDQGQAMHPADPGTYMAFALTPEQMEGLDTFWRTYKTGTTYTDYMPKYRADRGLQSVEGGCMAYLVHAEVGNGVSLAHALGVTRSKGPPNLYKKLCYAGNECVGPIGVSVNDLGQFLQMTDEQLKGEKPGTALLDSVKE